MYEVVTYLFKDLYSFLEELLNFLVFFVSFRGFSGDLYTT